MTLGFVQPPYPADGARAASASAVEFVFCALDGAAGDLVVLPECANAPGLTDPAELLRAAAGAEAFLRRAAESARGRGAAVAANVLQRLDGRL